MDPDSVLVWWIRNDLFWLQISSFLVNPDPGNTFRVYSFSDPELIQSRSWSRVFAEPDPDPDFLWSKIVKVHFNEIEIKIFDKKCYFFRPACLCFACHFWKYKNLEIFILRRKGLVRIRNKQMWIWNTGFFIPALQSGQWVRIRICFRDPDPGGQKLKKLRKCLMFSFEGWRLVL